MDDSVKELIEVAKVANETLIHVRLHDQICNELSTETLQSVSDRLKVAIDNVEKIHHLT